MTEISQQEKNDQALRRGSSGSNSNSDEVQGESSKSRESKHMAESSSKDPSALFMVSNTQDSAL